MRKLGLRGSEIQATYMRSWFQLRRVDSILVESIPLRKSLLGGVVISLVIPVEHIAREWFADAFAEFFDNGVWSVEKIISVNEADVDFFADSVSMTVGSIRSIRSISLCVLTSNFWSNLSNTAEVIEQSAELGVSSFLRIKVVESCDFVQRRDRAPVIRWDARSWVADQEGEVELLQESLWDDCWVVWLGNGVIWISIILDSLCIFGRCDIDFDVTFAVALAIRADSALVVNQRRGN